MNKIIFLPLFFGLVLALLTFEVKAGYDYTWNGSVSSNWNTNGNWSNGGGLYATGVHRVNSSGTSPVILANYFSQSS